ncbi:ras GTPase-activating protein 1-like protein, partial [Leptotrombidium deliense]
MSDQFAARKPLLFDCQQFVKRRSSSNVFRGNRNDEMNVDDEFDPFAGSDDLLDESVDIASSAPSQNLWYNGRMDRSTAEQRLQMAAKVGSYLVRESERKNGSFVLSYLGKTGINHFRITAVCGDYYIGGRQFHSLQHLIGYYTSVADLLKSERLLYPVPPQQPVRDKRKVVAILPYTKMPDTDELSFYKGDIFVVHNDLGNGWLWCTSYLSQESGLVFKDLVEELEDNVDPNEIYPWFHSCLNKKEAVEKLAKMGPGSFLVRPSDNSPGNYSLFFHIKNTVQRFRIERKGSKYVMGGRCFDSLEAVINRYKCEQIVEGFCLGDPVLKTPFETSLASRKAEEICNKSQDIYATLRESREMAKKDRSIRMKGYLDKKSQRHKKWKNLYFVLNSKDQLLSFFENERRTKPKGLVQLSYSFLYLVHDSLFERPNCFQLVERTLPCISTVYYLCAPTFDIAQEWIQEIRPLCAPQQQRGRGYSDVTEVRTLFISLVDAHRLPVKLVPHPFCIISLNKVKVCRTQVKCPPDPIWEEDFVLEDIPHDVTSFTITLFNKGKRSKDTEIAEVSVELKKLNNGEEFEDWFHLIGLNPPIREDWGALRVRLRYVHELIMPLYEYNALKELIMNDDLEAISVLEDFCHRDRGPLGNSLLRVFRYEKKETSLLKAMIEREIKRETETSTLFRMNSLTTTLMDQYMRSTCNDFLKKALQDSIQRVMETRQSCELNPSRLDSLNEACANAEHLLTLLDDVVDGIFHAVEACPRPLRFICGCLQRAVAAKWSNDPFVKTRVVGYVYYHVSFILSKRDNVRNDEQSFELLIQLLFYVIRGFIFLRLVCPAILNPRQFNLINDTPSEVAARSLILIAKCLQNLANLVEFGTKEPWMEVVNPFILKNKARMMKFLNDIS